MAFINQKSIIFALALSALLSLYVEATSRPLQIPIPGAPLTSEKVNPALERLCFSAEFPHECASAVAPFMSGSGTINPHSILQAGLKLLAQRALRAIEQAEKLKRESKSKEMTDHLSFCIQKYQAIGDSTRGAADALPARQFNKLESELDCMITNINKCEDVFGTSSDGRKSPLDEANSLLKMAAKNNLNIGNYVAMPALP